MEERKIIKTHTEVEHEEAVDPAIENINTGPDGSVQIQESNDGVHDETDSTTVREETTVQRRRST